MQLAGQVSSVGTTKPTPLPLRVGAKHSTCSGPSWRRYSRPNRPSTTPAGTKQSGRAHFTRRRPACCAISSHVLRLACTPHRHADGDRDRDESARCRDTGPLDKNARRIGVVGIPPPEESRRQVDRNAAPKLEPRLTKLRLVAQSPCGPLRRRPNGDEHDGENDGDLTPEDLRGGHRMAFERMNPTRRIVPPIRNSIPMCRTSYGRAC